MCMLFYVPDHTPPLDDRSSFITLHIYMIIITRQLQMWQTSTEKCTGFDM